MRRHHLTLLISLLVACDSSPDPDSTGSSRDLCQPDPALQASRVDCDRDDDCPCGAYCDLGRCNLDCTSDLECADGRVCDVFGRCGVDRAGELVAPLATAATGALVVEPLGLTVRPGRPEGVFSLRAAGAAIEAVRVLAPEGVQVSCDGGATFGPDCRLRDLVPEGGPASVRVEVTAPPPADGFSAFGVRIVSAADQASVDVRFGAALDAAPQSLAGHYRGTARVVGAGIAGRRTVQPVPDTFRGLALDVEAFVHGGATEPSAVELFDELGALFGPRGVVAALSGDLGTLELPAHRYLGDGSDDWLEVRVSGDGAVQRGTSGLSAQLRLDFLGVTEVEAAPYLELELALSRVGDVPSERPVATVPAPVEATQPGRRDQPLPVELDADAALAGLWSGEAGRPEAVVGRLCTAAGANSLGTWSPSVESVWSQEPSCVDGQTSAVAYVEDTGWSLGPQLEACAEDAAHAQDALRGNAAALGDRPCFDGGRLLAALGAALTTARERSAGVPALPFSASEALAHRTAQQWIEAHAFLAGQVRQAEELNRLLGPAEQIPWPAPPVTLLARSVRGWDAILNPRLGAGLVFLAPTVFQRPDPRPRVMAGFDAVSQPHHTFEVGLPVGIARGLKTQLDAVRDRLVLDRFALSGRDDLEDVAVGLAQRALVAYALARGQFDAARSQSPGELAWQSDWEAAEAALGGAIGGLARNLADFRAQTNPLGVDDDLDLPLYRTGPQVDAQARFAAVSEYLLGAPGANLATAWVPSQLAAADAAFRSARDAVADNLARDFARDLEDAARSRREEAIRRRYGEAIVSLCGDPSWDAFQVLDFADTIDTDACFLAPGCEQDLSARVAALEPGDWAYRLCLYGRAQARRGADALGPVTSISSSLLRRASAGDVVPVHLEAVADAVVVTFSDTTRVRIPENEWDAIDRLFLDTAFTPDAFEDDHAACDAIRQDVASVRPNQAPESCSYSVDCQNGTICRTELSQCERTPDDGSDDPACYRGALGELVLSLRASAREVEIARSELKEYGERYDRAMRSCILTQLGNDRIEGALRQHNDAVDDFAIGKLTADIAANAAAAVKDTAAAAGENVFASVTAGVAAGAEAAAKSTSDGLQFAIERLERAHAETMLSLENELEERVCFNDAELHLVGVRTAGLRIERASLDLARQLVEFENQKVSLGSFINEGIDALEREQQRKVTPTEMDFWLDADVERLDGAMRRAKRALYLATLAVEYELQLSYGRRFEILGARRPTTLRDIFESLQSLRGTGLVAGAAPSNRIAVVSLRRNLLQLADRSTFPDGWHQLTDVERFRALIMAPEHAAYDDQGQYLGQEIPFTISPLAAVGLGEAQGISILTGIDCAERLWSVNAALVGENLSAIPDSTVTDVVLRKRNTFYSQWCVGGPEAEPFQVASTRPNRNLFLDPYSSFGAGASTVGLPEPDRAAVDEVRAFTSARVRAFLGVPRGELERDDYFNGESKELAGRGLYGDYALFFPVETLSIDGSDGLRIENIEDVLLRLDYVSVASR